MSLLAWHGTILRVDRATGAWFHAALVPPHASADDLALDIPQDGLTHPQLLDDIVIEPATLPGCVHLRRDGRYLRARPASFPLIVSRDRTGPLETFLLVSQDVLAGLRGVLAAPARIAETGATTQATLGDGFTLRFDGAEVPIGLLDPAPGGLMLRVGGQTVTLQAADAAPPQRFILPSTDLEPPLARDAADFAQGKSKIMVVAGGDEYVFPPLTVSDADQVWMQRQHFSPEAAHWGKMSPRLELGRARDAFVLMGPLEGLIFTAAGVLNGAKDRLDGLPVLGAGPLSRHGATAFIDADVLRAAPVLAGPHIMFCGGIVGNFYHWMIEGMVPLCAIAPHVPPDAALLMPATLAAPQDGARPASLPDYDALLAAWGFGDRRRTTVAAPVCRVEELYWPRDFHFDAMPAAGFQAARRWALAQLPPLPAGPSRRILIRRTGKRRVRNAAEVEAALARHGFTTHEMPLLSPRAQMALFHEADFVISPHGADLSNMVFCEPGTKVIEFSPDQQFRSYFSQISDKLGFCHGVLPCPSSDGGFDGDVTVDVARLEALMAQMQARL